MSEQEKRAGRPPYPTEVRERAVRMVFDHQEDYPSQWKAIESISKKLSINHETLRQWVRRAETDAGQRPGLTTDERVKMRQLEREVKELRRANEMADSSGRRNELCELLRWCQIAEGLAWSAVETALDPAKICGGDLGQVGAFREVLAQEPVGVLVRAALPRRVGVAEVDGDAGGDGEAHVPGHLGSLVPGDRLAELVGQGGYGLAHGGVDAFGGAAVLQVKEQDQACGALDERAHGTPAALAQDDVALPVPRDGAVVNLLGALSDHHHAREPASFLHVSSVPPHGAP